MTDAVCYVCHGILSNKYENWMGLCLKDHFKLDVIIKTRGVFEPA